MLKNQDIIGKNFISLDFIPPDNMRFFKEKFRELLSTGKIDPVEVKIKNPNVKFPNLIHPNVIFDEKSLTLGYGSIITSGNEFLRILIKLYLYRWSRK